MKKLLLNSKGHDNCIRILLLLFNAYIMTYYDNNKLITILYGVGIL